MKRFFAEYRYTLPAIARRQGLSQEQCLAQALAALKCGPRPMAARDFNWLVTEHDLLQGRGTHFFIETEALAGFLVESVHHWNAALLEAVAEHAEGTHIVEFDAAVSKCSRGYARCASGIIHTCGSQPVAILFGIVFRGAEEEPVIIASTRDMWGCYVPSEITDSCVHDETKQAMNLLFGLCLYLACFPDALKPGFPECAKHPAHYKGRACALVRAVPQVLHHAGPVPHFRRGHFRTLRSACFTRRRWQVIFVADTFVKGTAVTVEDVR